ncbi:MAG: GntR family transcriptional regulator [Erysipelothrix sp.]|nr:GntR family transcriptional regulator [Erysipelothrix sp.]
MKIKDNATPIYRQIINYFEYEIASGVLERASKLSSIRELALEFKVNPNTVVRALADLEARELIYTDRTNGKFVSNDQALISGLKDQISKTSTKEYITSVKNLNMQVEEVINLLKVEWEDSDE